MTLSAQFITPLRITPLSLHADQSPTVAVGDQTGFLVLGPTLALAWVEMCMVEIKAGGDCFFSIPDPSEVFQTRRGGAIDPHTRLPGYTQSTILGVTQVCTYIYKIIVR